MWSVIVAIGHAIATAASAVADFIVAELVVIVHSLAAVVAYLGAAIKAGLWGLGQLVGEGLFHVADFFENVIGPAFSKLWGVFVRIEGWVKKVFAPVVKLLHTIRDHVLSIYKRFVRPVLDIIGVGRSMLSILSAAGLKFAQRLDAELARIESKIEWPFQWILKRLSQVENWVNRIVTVDGLFQRLTLIKSLERDAEYAWRTLVNSMSSLTGDPDKKVLQEKLQGMSVDQAQGAMRAYLSDGTGAYSPLIRELVAQMRITMRWR
jgi:hypothetical protein